MNSKANKLVIAIPLILAAVAIVVFAADTAGKEEKTVSGMVEATTIDVASKIPGRVDSVFFGEGDVVRKGQILAKLESKEMDAKVGQAEGALLSAENKYMMAQNGARREEKEAVKNLYLQSKHQYELAQKTYRRMRSLYNDSLLSAQEMDQYEFRFNAANEQMNAAKSKYEMVLKGVRPEKIRMAKGVYLRAQNAYKEAMAYYDELSIKCPANGIIEKRITDPGEIVASGYPVFTIISTKDSWVTIQLKETEIDGLEIGKILTGRVPALKNAEYKFKVVYISPMGDFANWRPTNQKGDFDIKTFEIKLKPETEINGLRPGMTAIINM